MTVKAQHTPQMSVEEFEELAAHVAKRFDAVRLEFINGRVGIEGMTDGNHNTIVMWLMRRCMQSRPDLDLYQGRGLRVEKYCKGRARPDGVLVPAAHFAGQGEWASTEGVLLVLEVTSYDSYTDQRDRKEKPLAYGDAGIPFYLLIDRDDASVTLYSDPAPGEGYRRADKRAFGVTLSLPEPLGFDLDTGELKQYAG
ncbi:Uma2 family endonuclease [Streptomyces thermoalcalitolerans]|uniref:Uma2 family endonuclease n=1 Tax=Streptomyces thermoalcalitolerans TaxID=65605 RepID=A0ABN1PAE2_9ACTN